MSKNIRIDEVGDMIIDIVGDYTKQVKEGLNETTEHYGKELLKVTKSKAPVRTGTYKRHLAVKKEKNMFGDVKSTVYVKDPHYRLAHLLEKGHALPQGGRTKPQPHFKPAKEEVKSKYIRDIKDVIENGGR